MITRKPVDFLVGDMFFSLKNDENVGDLKNLRFCGKLQWLICV